jgi:hypothetical protein
MIFSLSSAFRQHFLQPVVGIAYEQIFPNAVVIQIMSLVSTERSDIPRQMSGKCGFGPLFQHMV